MLVLWVLVLWVLILWTRVIFGLHRLTVPLW
jgi:hypothetical protein